MGCREDDVGVMVAVSVFVGLSLAWVVLLGLLKRPHASKSELEVSG